MLHAAVTASLLAAGLALLADDERHASYDDETASRVGLVRDDLDETERTIGELRERLETRGASPPAAAAPGRATATTWVEELVPAPDDPTVVLDRFAKRLAELHLRTESQRLHTYYGMVLAPLLPGYDAAALDRLKRGLATYALSAKAVPWGRIPASDADALARWRRYLLRIDGELRDVLGEDLTPEQVDLVHGRFAVRVPAEGEPLPSPRLGGKDGR